MKLATAERGEAQQSHVATGTEPVNDNAPLPTTSTLIADTMHCGLCLVTVEEALSKVPGVIDARVNLTTRRVRVRHDCARVGVEQLIETVQAAGYPAAELIDGREAETAARDMDFLKRLGVAGFAAANIMLLSVSVWSGSGSDMGAAVVLLVYAYVGFEQAVVPAGEARNPARDMPRGLLLGLGVAILLRDIRLGAVIGAAVVFNLLIAGFAGTLVPLGLKRLGADPAVASSVFVTMITDSMGFLLFLGLATATAG